MPKKILTVGFQLAGKDVTYKDFSSKASLLDWDVVLFKPDISGFINLSYDDSFQGKPSLNDHQSFKLRESCEHWRREIKDIVEGGKTVFVFLGEPKDVFIATGKKEFSGTGRNQKVTRIVTEYSSFSSFPIPSGGVATNGSEMVVCRDYIEIFQDYWKAFSEYSKYHFVFPKSTIETCITTKHGEKPVALVLKSKKSDGQLVLLPDIDFEDESFFSEREEKMYFNKIGIGFSAKLLKTLIRLDKALRLTGDVTPTPDWAETDKYSLNAEQELRKKLIHAEIGVEKAQGKKERIASELNDAGTLTPLLFESGKALEAAILVALRVLGFSAEQYEDSESEFDAVFESSEGRLIGEAEGKDTKAINIEKLRQLSLNIHEDLLRDEVDVPAKGILFGNGYRFIEPHERLTQFTTKCISSAVSTSVGLISTYDLYVMAKQQSDYPDDDFAKQCRELLINSVGVIVAPLNSVHENQVSEDALADTGK